MLVRDLRVALRSGGLVASFWRQCLVICAIGGAFAALLLFGPWGSSVGVYPYFLKMFAGFMVGVLGWGAFVMLLRTGARASAQWNAKCTTDNLTTSSGIYGTQDDWCFLAYGAGDVDNTLPAATGDKADTWVISSSDGQLQAVCPTAAAENVAAGEPFDVYNDVNCE